MRFDERTFTVSELVDAFKSGELRRDEEYQRGEVWDKV